MSQKLSPAEALLVLLDQVDYTTGACSLTEMVGAALDKNVIKLCRESLVSPAPVSEAWNAAIEEAAKVAEFYYKLEPEFSGPRFSIKVVGELLAKNIRALKRSGE